MFFMEWPLLYELDSEQGQSCISGSQASCSLSCCQVASVVSDSVQPCRRLPTRRPRPWDSPGKNTGVGCHFLLQCMKVKSESEVSLLYQISFLPLKYNLKNTVLQDSKARTWNSAVSAGREENNRSLSWINWRDRRRDGGGEERGHWGLRRDGDGGRKLDPWNGHK